MILENILLNQSFVYFSKTSNIKIARQCPDKKKKKCDTTDNQQLLTKNFSFNFYPYTMNWKRIKCHASNNLGVPQGSVLGSMLILFIYLFFYLGQVMFSVVFVVLQDLLKISERILSKSFPKEQCITFLWLSRSKSIQY